MKQQVIRRIIFFALGLLLLLVILWAITWFFWPASSPQPSPLPPSLPNGVAAGDVRATDAVLWARSNVTGPITFTFGIDLTSTFSQTTRSVLDPLLPVTLAVRDLQPATAYQYRVTTALGESAIGNFHTPALPNGFYGLRFGVSGDWRGELAPYPALGNAVSRNLDFFLALGDTIYADFASPLVSNRQASTLTEFRLKHSEVYSAGFTFNPLVDLRAHTAWLAVFDDHEVMNDPAGGAKAASDSRFGTNNGLINDAPLFEFGLQAFQEYNPLRSEFYGLVGGDGRMGNERKFYRYQTYSKDAALFVIDTRSFRDLPVRSLQSTDPAEVRTFQQAAFAPSRTMLGKAQLEILKRDLLDAEQRGITWKFIALPEPIQNLGPIGAQDRFEGYAAERRDLLDFISQQQMHNVVFIAADVHGSLVNNLSYQNAVDGPQLPSTAIEVTTGPVAFAPTFGPAIVSTAVHLGLLTTSEQARYEALPVKPDADSEVNDKDDFVKVFLNQLLTKMGNETIGLDPASARLLQRDYVSVHHFGWTEFAIDAPNQLLTITLYGILPYNRSELVADPVGIASRSPVIVSQMQLYPQQ